MPRKNEPEEYLPKQGMWAMDVLPPYRAVAQWCGGDVIKHGMKFAHIEVTTPEGNVHRIPHGGMIRQAYDRDGQIIGYYGLSVRDAEIFKERNRKASDCDCG